MYDKQKSFGERDGNKDIEFQYSETDSLLDFDASLSFKKDSFSNPDSILNFCLDIVDFQKLYLPGEDLEISQTGEWVKINLWISHDKEGEKGTPTKLYKLKNFFEELNPVIKKANGNSLDNLIHEFVKENPSLLFDEDLENEISNDLMINLKKDYQILENEVEYKEDPYIEAVLSWVTSRLNQAELIEYIIGDNLDKISEEHYTHLTPEVSDAVKGWMEYEGGFPREERLSSKTRLCKLIKRNLNDLIESQKELEKNIYLNKK